MGLCVMISECWYYAMIADGTLKTAKIRGRRVVPRDAALALLSKGGK